MHIWVGGVHFRALLLDGSITDEMHQIREATADLLRNRGFQVETVPLKERNIGYCKGCLGCWVRSPGVCVIPDDEHFINRSFVNAALIVLLTPVTFGGYSHYLKKALDRMICTMLPHLEKYRGEVRHPRRYETAQRLVFVGFLPQRDNEAQSVFRELSKRNALNLRPVGWSTALVFSNERLEMASIAIREAFLKAGVQV